MNIRSYIGTTVRIIPGLGIDSLDPQAHFNAYLNSLATAPTVGKVISIGAVGDTHNAIEIESVGEGRVSRVIGAADAGILEFSIASDKDDAGQQLLEAINGFNQNNTFYIEDEFGSIVSFYGSVFSLRSTDRTAGAYRGKTFQVIVNSPITRLFYKEVDWTLMDIPANWRIGLWRPKDAVLVDGAVSSIPNAFGGVAMDQADATRRPTRSADGKFLVFPDAASSVQLVASSVIYPGYFALGAQYKTGVEATFAETQYLMGNGWGGGVGNNARYQAQISAGADTSVWKVDSSTWPAKIRRNGEATFTALPSGMSMYEFAGSSSNWGDTSYRWGIARPSYGDSSWRGQIGPVLALTAEPAGDLLERIQGALSWEIGNNPRLPADHRYRNAPPKKLVLQ